MLSQVASQLEQQNENSLASHSSVADELPNDKETTRKQVIKTSLRNSDNREISLDCDTVENNKIAGSRDRPVNPQRTSTTKQSQSPSNISGVVTDLNEPRLSYGGSFDDHPGASLPIMPENYQSEEERIESFAGWPLNEAVHPEQLARVGFVYTGDGALVQCFQCGVKYRNWYKGDVPLNVHQKCNPRCSFLQTLTSKSKSPPPERRPNRSYIQPESLPIGSNTQSEEVSKHSLQFPDYSDQAIRLQSFKHWGGVLPVHELAEAGFYMIARHDIVRCHSCNVVVQDWESSDNVIDEHHRLSPDCNYVHRFMSSNGMFSVGKSGTESLKLSDSADTTLKLVPSGGNHDPQNDDGAALIFQSVSDNDNIGCEQFTLFQKIVPRPVGVQCSDDDEEQLVQGLPPYCEATITPVTVCEACSMTIFDSCQHCPECERPVSIIKYLLL